MPLKSTEELLLALCRAGLMKGAGAAALPGPLLTGESWLGVYKLACRNSVTGAAWVGIENLGGPERLAVPEKLAARWRRDADMTMWRLFQFDAERERIFAKMTQAGIAHLPLKGPVIASLYPDPRMRYMSDNDILYGFVAVDKSGGVHSRGRSPFARAREAKACALRLQTLMEEDGYKTEGILEWHHDEYLKDPLFNFEMHRGLVAPDSSTSSFWASPWCFAIPAAGDDPLLFRMDAEHEYLFHICHAYDHYVKSGCGIRHILDEMVLLRAYGASMDWGVISCDLRQMGERLQSFELDMRRAALAYLGDDSERVAYDSATNWEALRKDALGIRANGDACGFAQSLLASGTYGTRAKRLERASLNAGSTMKSKLGYLKRRIDMDPVGRRLEHPVLGSYRPLYPLFVLVRAMKAARNFPRVIEELRTVFQGHK